MYRIGNICPLMESSVMMTSPSADLLFAQMLHQGATNRAPGQPVSPPLVSASTYELPGIPDADYQYGRWNQPTWTVLEDALGVLEQAETVIFPSGMAAISAVLFAHLGRGDRVLVPNDGYYNTRTVAEDYLGSIGVKVESAATTEYASRDFDGFSLIFVETPSNPKLDVCDIRDVVTRAHAAGALVVVDNTTMTPLGQRPLELGADVVVASDTKALNGHSDVLAGHVSSNDPTILERVRTWRKLVGGIPGSFEAWLVHRGLETLEVRFDRMCTTASVLAQRLQEESLVTDVAFPGLDNRPDREIIDAQMLRSGSLVGVTFANAQMAEAFIDKAKYIMATTSFGGTHTSAERRARWGDAVPEGFVRLSVGCEPTEQLWTDISRVLDELRGNR